MEQLELLRDAALIGVAVSAAVGIKDLDNARHFLGGVLGSLGYLLALTFKSDSVSRSEWSGLQKNLGKTRYLWLSMPFLLLAAQSYKDGHELNFGMIDTRSFVWTAGGALSYRVGLIGRQVRRAKGAANTRGGP